MVALSMPWRTEANRSTVEGRAGSDSRNIAQNGYGVFVIEENWQDVVDGVVRAIFALVLAPALLGLQGFDSDTFGEWALFFAVATATFMLYAAARRLLVKLWANRRA